MYIILCFIAIKLNYCCRCVGTFSLATRIDIYFIQQRRYNMNYHCLLTNRIFLTLYTYFKCDALISSK